MPKKWRNKEDYNSYMRAWRKRRRMEIIELLGGKCEICGNSNLFVLSINGSKKKKILCHNCRESLKIKI